MKSFREFLKEQDEMTKEKAFSILGKTTTGWTFDSKKNLAENINNNSSYALNSFLKSENTQIRNAVEYLLSMTPEELGPVNTWPVPFVFSVGALTKGDDKGLDTGNLGSFEEFLGKNEGVIAKNLENKLTRETDEVKPGDPGFIASAKSGPAQIKQAPEKAEPVEEPKEEPEQKVATPKEEPEQKPQAQQQPTGDSITDGLWKIQDKEQLQAYTARISSEVDKLRAEIQSKLEALRSASQGTNESVVEELSMLLEATPTPQQFADAEKSLISLQQKFNNIAEKNLKKIQDSVYIKDLIQQKSAINKAWNEINSAKRNVEYEMDKKFTPGFFQSLGKGIARAGKAAVEGIKKAPGAVISGAKEMVGRTVDAAFGAGTGAKAEAAIGQGVSKAVAGAKAMGAQAASAIKSNIEASKAAGQVKADIKTANTVQKIEADSTRFGEARPAAKALKNAISSYYQTKEGTQEQKNAWAQVQAAWNSAKAEAGESTAANVGQAIKQGAQAVGSGVKAVGQAVGAQAGRMAAGMKSALAKRNTPVQQVAPQPVPQQPKAPQEEPKKVLPDILLDIAKNPPQLDVQGVPPQLPQQPRTREQIAQSAANKKLVNNRNRALGGVIRRR